MNMVEPVDLNIAEKLKDPAYRKAFFRFHDHDMLLIRIRELREAAGLSQLQLAERAQMKQSAICRIESGDHSPNHRTLERLAEALNVRMVITFQPYPEKP